MSYPFPKLVVVVLSEDAVSLRKLLLEDDGVGESKKRQAIIYNIILQI